jgi:hypothetical protein
MICHCDFNLHLPSDWWCQAFSHLSVSHMSSFEKCLSYSDSFAHLLIRLLSPYRVAEFLIYFGYLSIFRCMACKYLFLVCNHVSLFCCFPCGAEAFCFNVIPFAHSIHTKMILQKWRWNKDISKWRKTKRILF